MPNQTEHSANPSTQATQATQASPPSHPDFPPGPYPIIFIRGFAFGEDAIEATANTPFMGFNLGSTQHRQLWTGELIRLHFPSPLIRLMDDVGYRAIDVDQYHPSTYQTSQANPSPGDPPDAPDAPDPLNHQHRPDHQAPLDHPAPLDPRSIIIHRYYDRAHPDFDAWHKRPATGPDEPFIDTTPPTILEAAQDLGDLIDHLRARHANNPQAFKDHGIPFGVHLVAHSMGGLIARALLQHPDLKHTKAAQAINTVFTYATPHGGITLGGFEMPRFLRLQHAHHFHKKHLAQLFDAPNADDLNNDFPTHRFFSLIGTNHQDYGAGRGITRHLAGPLSDGLVQIQRAAVKHTPRAHVHRTHGGPFGIVNSEAGYNNLVRFLFGRLRLDARLELQSLPLPPELQRAKDQGHRINASYWIEASLAPRPNPIEGERAPVYLTERRQANHSAIFRGYDELMHPERLKATQPPSTQTPEPRHPVLFSAFLDPRHSADQHNIVLSLELKVSATDYAIDGEIHPEYSLAGQTLYQDTLKLTFSPSCPPQAAAPSPPSSLPSSRPPSRHASATATQTPTPCAERWALEVASISQPWAEPERVADTPADTPNNRTANPKANPNASTDPAPPTQAFAIPLTRGPQLSPTADPHRHPPRRDFQATLKLQLTHRGGRA